MPEDLVGASALPPPHAANALLINSSIKLFVVFMEWF
jgi:hypothetical protein